MFAQVFEEIELGSPASAEDDDERVAVGRIYVAASKMYSRVGKTAEADAALARALEFLGALKSIRSFAAPHYADALLLAGDPKAATSLIRCQRQDAFRHLRRAEAIHQTGGAGALECIDRDIALIKLPKYRATFLAAKADLLHVARDSRATAVLREAIACCEEDRFPGSI